jgi:hypothetical protein
VARGVTFRPVIVLDRMLDPYPRYHNGLSIACSLTFHSGSLFSAAMVSVDSARKPGSSAVESTGNVGKMERYGRLHIFKVGACGEYYWYCKLYSVV